jgi:hypothetical protein
MLLYAYMCCVIVCVLLFSSVWLCGCCYLILMVVLLFVWYCCDEVCNCVDVVAWWCCIIIVYVYYVRCVVMWLVRPFTKLEQFYGDEWQRTSLTRPHSEECSLRRMARQGQQSREGWNGWPGTIQHTYYKYFYIINILI